MSGVKARLWLDEYSSQAKFQHNLLVCGVKEENEREHSVSGVLVACLSVHRGARGLQRKEHCHTRSGRDEQQTTTQTLDHERCKTRPEEVPDLEDTVDEELSGRVCDANAIEHLVEVVRHKTIARPLREEGDGNNDPETLKVASLREK